MSMEWAFDDQPVTYILRSPVPSRTTAGGLANPDQFQQIAGVRGRLEQNTASQKAFWETLGVECDYTFYTCSALIQNGDVLKAATPTLGYRFFRVTGARGDEVTFGTGVGPLFKYPLKETTALVPGGVK